MANKHAKGPVSQDKIEKDILSALRQAQKDYYKMSGGWLCNDEHWLTSYVATYLWDRCGDGSVFLEANIYETLEEAGRSPGQPRIAVSKEQMRYDIVLYWSKGHPRAVIEIKNALFQPFNPGVVIEDVERVVASLKSASFNFGVVGYAVSKEGSDRKGGQEKLEDHVEDIEKRAKNCASKERLKSRFIKYPLYEYKKENMAWMVACIIIEK